MGRRDAGVADAVEFEVRRSERARHARVQVTHEGVRVVLPAAAPERLAAELVREKAAWIDRALAKVAIQDAQVRSRPLADGGVVPYLGRDLALGVRVVETGERTSVAADLRRATVRVRAAGVRPDQIAAPLERWFRRRARVEVATRLDHVTALNGTRYAKLSIRDQTTRWGSCSAAGAMSFNWRLMLAPEAVLDYVVEHEAAHLEVRDHSPRFWTLLDERMPDWRDWRRWLRDRGATLRLV